MNYTRISIVLFAGLFLILPSLNSQSDSPWMSRFSIGIEQHDKRLFDFSEKETLLHDQRDEEWGTYHIRLQQYYEIINLSRLSIYGGAGLGYEKATFTRPFEHKFFEPISFDILRYQNHYEKLLTSLSVMLQLRVFDNLFLFGSIAPNVLVFRRIQYKNEFKGGDVFSQAAFEIDEVNFNAGLEYRFHSFRIGFNSRLWNFQKIDKIIFNSILKDPRTDQKWEWYNPLQFNVTVGYEW